MNTKIRPAHDEKCQFDLGEKHYCPCKATMSLNGKTVCDRHAELAMVSICGRNVKINRVK